MVNFNRSIISLSVSNETRKHFVELDKIRPNGVSFSSFLGSVSKEYTERHNSGDYKIEDFTSEEVSLTPKFFAEISLWKKHVLGLDNMRYNDFSERLVQLNNLKRIRLNGMISW